VTPVISGLKHIGIAVRDIEEARKLYRDAFKLDVGEVQIAEELGLKIAWVDVGNTRIELLAPAGSGGGIARFIEEKGEGVHHVALEVKDIRRTLEALNEKGITSAMKEPRTGLEGALVSFLKPEKTGMVRIELVEAERAVEA
jgi:methylmalonyl-CoA epimerase